MAPTAHTATVWKKPARESTCTPTMAGRYAVRGSSVRTSVSSCPESSRAACADAIAAKKPPAARAVPFRSNRGSNSMPHTAKNTTKQMPAQGKCCKVIAPISRSPPSTGRFAPRARCVQYGKRKREAQAPAPQAAAPQARERPKRHPSSIDVPKKELPPSGDRAAGWRAIKRPAR